MIAKLALITGILGASLVSFKLGIGYVLFLASGILSVYIFYKTKQHEMLVLNAVYSVININGLFQYFI